MVWVTDEQSVGQVLPWPVFVNKALLEPQPCSLVYELSKATFMLQ